MFSFINITLHLNVLNKKLQTRGKTIEVKFGLMKAFETKLDNFVKEVASQELNHFPKQKIFTDDTEKFEKIT